MYSAPSSGVEYRTHSPLFRDDSLARFDADRALPSFDIQGPPQDNRELVELRCLPRL